MGTAVAAWFGFESAVFWVTDESATGGSAAATDGSGAKTGGSGVGVVAVSVAAGCDCWGVRTGVCWAALGLLGGAAGAARRTGAFGANFLPDLSAETA